MRRASALAALAVMAAGCSSMPATPGPPDVDLDSRALREMKSRIGMADCEPGSGQGPVEGGLPSVTLTCLGGGQDIDLSALRGPMILNFWASWCAPCADEMPALQAFQAAHGTQVPILGMNVNDLNPDRALSLAESTGATYPSVADPGGEIYAHEQFRRVQRGFPAFMFIAEDGTIAGATSGGVDSVTEIEDLVTELLGVRLS